MQISISAHHSPINLLRYFLNILLLLPIAAYAQQLSPDSVAKILSPLDQALPAAKPGEWRHQYFEPTQSIESFQKNFGLNCGETHIKIYALGKFNDIDNKLLQEVEQFLELYYQTDIVLLRQQLKHIPKNAFIKTNGHKQLDTRYVNSLIYNPKYKEAIVSLAICEWDITNSPTTNFVFGESDPLNKIGCCSMYRLNDENYNLTLLRLIKTCIHEINHMLGMEHCNTNYCNMNGNNSVQEIDQHPAYLCSECAGKLSLLNEFPTQENTMALMTFCKMKGWDKEVMYYEKILSLQRKE